MPKTDYELAREDALFQQRRLRGWPMRFNRLGIPFTGLLTTFTAPRTMQIRRILLSMAQCPAGADYQVTLTLSPSASFAAIQSNQNEDSSVFEAMLQTGYGSLPCEVYRGTGEYDGYYLNKGEKLYLYATFNQWNGAVQGGAWIAGTVMLYYLPTYRQN